MVSFSRLQCTFVSVVCSTVSIIYPILNAEGEPTRHEGLDLFADEGTHVLYVVIR